MSDETTPLAWLEYANGTRVTLTGDCSIGRMPDNKLVMQDEQVSRHHALIQHRENDEFWLVDLGSSNGTYVNHRRVRAPLLLHDGDSVFLGDFCLHFHQNVALKDATPEKPTLFQIKSIHAWLLVTDIVGSSSLHKKLSLNGARAAIHAWMNTSRRLVETHNGVVNQFLGDGVFAYWLDEAEAENNVSRALTDFGQLRTESSIPFRLVLHYGSALTGGNFLGEENLHGPDVNFVFRMEHLAKRLGEFCLISDPALFRLHGQLATAILGRYPIPGIEEKMLFHAIR